MAKFLKMDRDSLAALPEFNETMVQTYIFEHPEVLDIGEVHGLKREKAQQAGGRIDMVLEDGETWYEIEVQLGATDPSHIIRTIEYWDNERWRYPQFNHVAVLIAEEVTGRFFNVISLFNKHIPLIAFQMSAFRRDDGDVNLVFSKVLDLTTREVVEEIDTKVIDYNYWVETVGTDRMETTSRIFDDMLHSDDGFRMKFNKHYIGVLKDGVVKNFVEFEPRKSTTVLRIKLPGTEQYDSVLEGLDWRYDTVWDRYHVKFTTFEKYLNAKLKIMPLMVKAAELMGVELEYEEERFESVNA